MQHGGDGLEVEQFLGAQLAQSDHRLAQMPGGLVVEVVLNHEAAIVLDPAHQLLELEAHQPAVGAELDD